MGSTLKNPYSIFDSEDGDNRNTWTRQEGTERILTWFSLTAGHNRDADPCIYSVMRELLV